MIFGPGGEVVWKKGDIAFHSNLAGHISKLLPSKPCTTQPVPQLSSLWALLLLSLPIKLYHLYSFTPTLRLLYHHTSEFFFSPYSLHSNSYCFTSLDSHCCIDSKALVFFYPETVNLEAYKRQCNGLGAFCGNVNSSNMVLLAKGVTL